ncbi:hypothetical protein JTB14_001357 [Gonioctena quinquepunctata]|nr:hypothetical protein JTB14_001357 [Gonioctena quinquepunctata]
MKAVNKYGFTINQDKSSYAKTSINLLGYKIEINTISPDPDRLKPLLSLSPPNNPKELQRSIGMFAHYSRGVPNYSDEVKKLLNAETIFLSPEAKCNSEDLKIEISKAVVKTVDVKETPPISAVLSQAGRPVGFFSQELNDSKMKHSAVEKEAYAVMGALKK